MENNVVNLYGKLNTLLLTYDHEMIYNWIDSNFLKNRSNRTSVSRSSPSKRSENRSLTHRFLTRYIFNGCAEFCQVSALTRLSKNSSSFGFSHMKLILEQAKEKRATKYESYLPRLLLSDRHWQTEVLIESLYWTFEDERVEGNASKRVHVWRTPFHLGMALVKFGTMENVETKVESLLDTLQVEWSRELADYVLLAVKCFKQYGTGREKTLDRTRATCTDIAVSINVALTHFNCFFLAENGR